MNLNPGLLFFYPPHFLFPHVGQQMADHQSFLFTVGQRHINQHLCVGGREKNFSLSFHPVCRSRPFDPSPLCLYTTPDGLYQPGKKKGKKKSQCECNITTLSSYYYSNVQPLYPRFQSAIWLSMMRWLEREMIVCEAIRETGTNGLVYTHTHTHTSIYSIYIVLQCSHNKPPRRIANKNPPNDWLARPLGQWPLSYSLYDGWWVYALRVSTLLAFIFFFLVFVKFFFSVGSLYEKSFHIHVLLSGAC